MISCGAVVFRYINARTVMLWAMIAGGLGTAVAPIVPAIWIVHVGQFFTGLSNGVFECGKFGSGGSDKRYQLQDPFNCAVIKNNDEMYS